MSSRSEELQGAVPTAASADRGLFAKKSMDMLLSESKEAGEHSLKRTLGPFQLTALGVGAVIGAGIFVLSGLGAHYAGPALMLSFVLSGLGCAFAALCYAEFAAMIPLAGSAYTYAYATLGEIFAWIIGWDLTLEYAMGASTVSSGWSNHFIELLDIFHIKMPLWLAYDHWTALHTAEKLVARQMAQASDASLVPGTQAFLDKVSAIVAAQSPELAAARARSARRAHDLRRGDRLQPAGLRHRAGDHRHPVHRHQGKRPLQRHHRGHQGFGGAVRDRPGSPNTFPRRTGVATGTASRPSASAASAPARPTSSSPTSDSTPSRPPRRKPRIRSAILPIGIIVSLLICTILYISVAGVLTGMVPWHEVNIEAPIARAFMDRGLTTASHVITLGALAGLTSVMLVMLLGQTRVLYSMANDGLLPKKFFAAIHPKFRTPYKNTIAVGLLAAIVGSITPIDDIGKMVNIGTLLAFVIVCIAVMVLRRTNPGQARPFRTPWVPRRSRFWASCSTAT